MKKCTTNEEPKTKAKLQERIYADRSFNLTSKSMNAEGTLPRERSQSYSEDRRAPKFADIQPLIESKCSEQYASDDNLSENNDLNAEKPVVERSEFQNAVNEGRYFLGESLGRAPLELNGSYANSDHVDNVNDDQLDWEDEFKLASL